MYHQVLNAAIIYCLLIYNLYKFIIYNVQHLAGKCGAKLINISEIIIGFYCRPFDSYKSPMIWF